MYKTPIILITLLGIALLALAFFVGWSAAKFQDAVFIKEREEYHKSQTALLNKEMSTMNMACDQKVMDKVDEIRNNKGK